MHLSIAIYLRNRHFLRSAFTRHKKHLHHFNKRFSPCVWSIILTSAAKYFYHRLPDNHVLQGIGFLISIRIGNGDKFSQPQQSVQGLGTERNDEMSVQLSKHKNKKRILWKLGLPETNIKEIRMDVWNCHMLVQNLSGKSFWQLGTGFSILGRR